MVKGIIGKKVGMTQLFDENGKVVPVTVIEAGPCTVVQKKTVESDGYQAVQLGFGEVSAKKVNKAAAGHFKKANVAPKKTLREFRLEDVSAMNVGDVLKADVFAAGDKVDVVGVSKGKGYQGVIKRYGQHRLRESHGTGPVARHAGSNGSTSTPARVFPGKRQPCENIPVGTIIHNIELYPGRGAQLVRSAGNMAQLMAKENGYALVRLPSGEMRNVPLNCTAVVGQVSNIDHENVNLGKAGRKRHMGVRPGSRGTVMNPCDHPHGGGEGRAPVGHSGPMTPWGKPALGLKTRKHHKRSDKLIVKRAGK